MNPLKVERLHLIMGVHCNVRCVMCYQTSFSRDLAMPAEIYREHLQPLYSHVKTVKLQGGEPTVMRNCKEFCLLARDFPQLKVAVTTNGINLNRFWLATLVNQGRYVNISLNAAHEESYGRVVKYGDFHKVVNNISRLVEANQGGELGVAMSMIIIPANVKDIADFLRLGISLGVGEINFGFDPLLSFRHLPPKEELHPILERAFDLLAESGVRSEGLEVYARRVGYDPGPEALAKVPAHCSLPFNNVVVDEKGEVRLCCNTWVSVGNTYEQGIAEILDGPKARRFRKMIKKGNYRWCDPKCPDNPHPHRLATAHKYLHQARKDPKEFAGKVKAKLGKLGKV
ncbi:MAG: radical SAM protein [Desulfarculaceae bacterium]|nr:radical SAM protein [Desulfarculaceae bacterium]